ncbi:hypothetical protein B0J13DRAFT_534247 [Dactylonectria estremocensis]|uniref:Uncharacterized protein n=1 Tax=Dactylonectria estremocensis TaxID=1079267 RepID=A0A9P9D2U7_9HYPO|nr:hypothetical protein B0J13DRAFT_534247 [Dactylonectria estremocensis]
MSVALTALPQSEAGPGPRGLLGQCEVRQVIEGSDGCLQVQEIDLDSNRSGADLACNDVSRVFSGMFDKTGIEARYLSKPDGRSAQGEIAGRREPFSITTPSIVETAKTLGADLPSRFTTAWRKGSKRKSENKGHYSDLSPLLARILDEP